MSTISLPTALTATQSSIVSRAVAPAAVVIAPVALGLALQVNFGQLAPAAIGWLTVALVACFITFRRTMGDNVGFGLDGPASRLALLAGLMVQFVVLLTSVPMATLVVNSPLTLLPFRGAVLVAALGVWLALRRANGLESTDGKNVARVFNPSATIFRRVARYSEQVSSSAAMDAESVGIRHKHARVENPCYGKIALSLVLLGYFLAGFWTLRVVPPPAVDVCLFQREACHALLHGHNPYAITFPVPYKDPARVYGPGTFANGRLLFGYPYPPISLLLIIPGYLLGDFRYAHLAAMTLAGLFIGLSRPGRIATCAAAMLLFTPRGFFVLEAGWTEPLVIVMFSVTFFLAVRKKRSSLFAFGFMLATKQYLILVAPLMGMLWQRLPAGGQTTARFRCQDTKPQTWFTALIIPACVSLPLLLWNVPAFVHSAMLLQFHQPLRIDALSYSAFLAMNTSRHLPAWEPFVAAATVILFALYKRAMHPSAFAATIALALLLFFALNKQAFCNYYLLVIAAMCMTLAAAEEKPHLPV